MIYQKKKNHAVTIMRALKKKKDNYKAKSSIYYNKIKKEMSKIDKTNISMLF